MLSLVIGGARSGKSRFAQSLCANGARVVYVATARPDDDEMARRIQRHRNSRPSHWLTIEEPVAIAHAVEHHSTACDVLLLDCLTLWLSNFCWEHRTELEGAIEQAAFSEVARLAPAAASSHLIVVTNEVGCGLVPEDPVGRLFRDLQGFVNQQVACSADWVYHVVAGIAVPIKQPGARP
jgi:adenosylcobinamide kinase/adenosylcobinamide-phosphate guanylyltransferase